MFSYFALNMYCGTFLHKIKCCGDLEKNIRFLFLWRTNGNYAKKNLSESGLLLQFHGYGDVHVMLALCENMK